MQRASRQCCCGWTNSAHKAVRSGLLSAHAVRSTTWFWTPSLERCRRAKPGTRRARANFGTGASLRWPCPRQNRPPPTGGPPMHRHIGQAHKMAVHVQASPWRCRRMRGPQPEMRTQTLRASRARRGARFGPCRQGVRPPLSPPTAAGGSHRSRQAEPYLSGQPWRPAKCVGRRKAKPGRHPPSLVESWRNMLGR